jgi:hypothetical protein
VEPLSEKNRRCSPGEGAEPGGQLLGGFVTEVGEDHLLQLLGLARNRRRNGRFGVTVQGHPPAADGVDQAPAIL